MSINSCLFCDNSKESVLQFLSLTVRRVEPIMGRQISVTDVTDTQQRVYYLFPSLPTVLSV